MNKYLSEKSKKNWHDYFSRSGYFIVVLLLNLILFILVGSSIVFKGLQPSVSNTTFLPVHIAPPKPPPEPPAPKGGSVQNFLEPSLNVALPPLNISVLTTANTSAFTINSANNHTVNLPSSLTTQQGTSLPGRGVPGPDAGTGDNPFGSSTTNGEELTGYMYDLKQTVDRKPTGMTPGKYAEILSDFVAHDWDESIIAPYYKSSKPIYTSHILVPNMPAYAGPKAFHLENEVQPNMWFIWYKGKITAPKTGYYYFAGFCDDILLVRIDGRTILDGSINVIDQDLPRETPWPNDWIEDGMPWLHYGELRKSLSVSLSSFHPSDIDIIIGEQPGGSFNASLFVLNPNETYPVDAGGEPILPLFEVGSTETKFDGVHPPVSPQSIGW